MNANFSFNDKGFFWVESCICDVFVDKFFIRQYLFLILVKICQSVIHCRYEIFSNEERAR